MLVVDDNSPDGTGRSRPLAASRRVSVASAAGKFGLGSATCSLRDSALEHRYLLFTMDADFSQTPHLPRAGRASSRRAEFVIGSRYTAGGRSRQTLSRVILSRGANGLTRLLLGIPVRGATTSYRGFRRSLLARLDIDAAIESEGYSFFVESIFQVSRRARQDGDTQPMAEFPILFADRRKGITKISRVEIWRGMTTLARLAARRVAGATGQQ